VETKQFESAGTNRRIAGGKNVQGSGNLGHGCSPIMHPNLEITSYPFGWFFAARGRLMKSCAN
jgi:hypothetical protein